MAGRQISTEISCQLDPKECTSKSRNLVACVFFFWGHGKKEENNWNISKRNLLNYPQNFQHGLNLHCKNMFEIQLHMWEFEVSGIVAEKES